MCFSPPKRLLNEVEIKAADRMAVILKLRSWWVFGARGGKIFGLPGLSGEGSRKFLHQPLPPRCSGLYLKKFKLLVQP
jgi:hypothetical protein